MDFGSILKKLRTEKNITQEELSKILNVSRPTIGRYEINERFPDHENLIKLSKFFNVSIDYLLGLTDIREPAKKLIEKGEVSIKPPSKIEKLYENLPSEEKRLFEDYTQYLAIRAQLNSKDKKNSCSEPDNS